MRRYLHPCAVLLLLCAPTSAQPNLISDPGFALAVPGTLTSNSDWSLTANQPGGADLAAQYEDNFAGDPADAGNDTGVWFKAFEGAMNLGDPLAQATLSQVIPAVPAGDYSLEFSVRLEGNFQAGSWSATLSSSGTGGTDQLDLLASVPNDGSWTTRNLALTGVSAGDDLTVTVEMVDGEEADANPQSAFVDLFILRGTGVTVSPTEIPTLAPSAIVALALLLAAVGVWVARR